MSFNGKRVALLLLAATLASSPAMSASASPLDAFGALVVGQWETEDSRHVLEWGVGQKVIRSRSYYKTEDGWRLVSEGMWFWDDGEKTIRGVVVAVGMPVELFEYSSKLRGDEVVHDLVAQGPAGGEFVERWVFADDEYSWSLEVENEGAPEKIMDGSYRRVRAKP